MQAGSHQLPASLHAALDRGNMAAVEIKLKLPRRPTLTLVQTLVGGCNLSL